MREVAAINDNRCYMGIQVRLIAVGGHPGSAAFGRAHIKVKQENANAGTISFVSFKGLHIRVIEREVGARLEADAVEFSKSGCLWADHKMNIISKDLHDDTCLLHCKCHRGKAKARKRKKR